MRSIADKALRGVSTQCVTFRMCAILGQRIDEGSMIRLYAGGNSFSTFYAANVESDGSIYSVTAYDRCKNLDIPFDYSNYQQYDGSGQKTSDHVMWYNTGTVLGDIANQCGFANSAPSMRRVTRLCYKNIEGKSCRQILEEISAAECGFFYCDAEDHLAFMVFSPDLAGNRLSVTDENRAEIRVSGTKTITDVFSEDETYSIITKQTTSEWTHTEIISGKYMNAVNAAAVAAQVLGSRGSYIYSGWRCGAVLMLLTAPLNASIYYDELYLPCYEQKYRFVFEAVTMQTMMIAEFGAAKPDTSYSQYQSLYQRELAGKVTLNKSMGCLFLSESGSGVRIKM